MGKGRHRSQDLDQALSIQLAGSTAGRNELCQSDVAHLASQARVGRIPIRGRPGCRPFESLRDRSRSDCSSRVAKHIRDAPALPTRPGRAQRVFRAWEGSGTVGP